MNRKTSETLDRVNAKLKDDFYDMVLEGVDDDGDSWTLKCKGGGCLCVNKKKGITPKAGDTARFYGKGVGYTVRGVDINGKELYYMTEAESNAQHEKWCKKKDLEDQKNYRKNKSELNKDIAKMPEPFQARIQRLRKKNPDFGHKFEAYEVFCCQEAITIAKALKTEDAIIEFQKESCEKQQKMVPKARLGDHSGNTFGASCMLARFYLTKPRLIPFAHGALATLVGCKDYGCHPLDPDEEKLVKELN